MRHLEGALATVGISPPPIADHSRLPGLVPSLAMTKPIGVVAYRLRGVPARGRTMIHPQRVHICFYLHHAQTAFFVGFYLIFTEYISKFAYQHIVENLIV